MNVSLTPHFEELVKRKVESGQYNSASEVVREGLRLIEERDKLNAAKVDILRRDVQQAMDSLARGEGHEVTDENIDQFFADIREEGMKRLKARGLKE